MSEQSVEKEPEDMKIDLLDIFSRIIAIRKKLYKATIIGLLIAIIVWASIPKKYTVTVMLSPEMSSDKGSNGPGKTHYTFSFIFYTFILHEYRLFILLIRYLSFIYNII